MPPNKPGRPAKGTSKAKPVALTAANERPRRAVPAAKSTPAVTAPNKTTSTGNKRGRPAKQAAVEDEPKAKRGRPAKAKDADHEDAKAATAKKASAETQNKSDAAASPVDVKKRGRGRPPKAAKDSAPAVPKSETAPPKKRGRPPKGGETTKITSDDSAAADQLEEELQETADEPEAVEEADESAVDGAADEEALRKHRSAAEQTSVRNAASGKQFWLMKAEQEDREEVTKSGKTFNTKFTIDDLHAKGGPEPWDGVRNPVAAKNMRAMQQGDLAFFYASGGKAGRKPGIVGIMEVVKEHESDPSTADDEHYAYVEKEADRAKWCVVHVEFRKKLSKPVLLSDLQKQGKDSGVLSNMDVLRYSRLSVTKVTEEEWNFIHENLIEGYEKEVDAFPASSAVQDAARVVQKTAVATVDALESTLTTITEAATNLVENAASILSPVPTASAL